MVKSKYLDFEIVKKRARELRSNTCYISFKVGKFLGYLRIQIMCVPLFTK